MEVNLMSPGMKVVLFLSRRGRREGQSQRDQRILRHWLCRWRKGPRAKEHGRPLEAHKSETQILPQTLQRKHNAANATATDFGLPTSRTVT